VERDLAREVIIDFAIYDRGRALIAVESGQAVLNGSVDGGRSGDRTPNVQSGLFRKVESTLAILISYGCLLGLVVGSLLTH
jgi:hypothetical protein